MGVRIQPIASVLVGQTFLDEVVKRLEDGITRWIQCCGALLIVGRRARPAGRSRPARKLAPNRQRPRHGARASEAQERWLVEFNRVKQTRDEAAATFRRYRELSQEILHLFALAAEIDREIDHVNASAPYGVHQRLRYVENEARNVEFSRDRPSLAATVELRDWDNSGRMLWPQ
jgi:hypothetical protein